MLANENRLKKQKDFKKVLRKGKGEKAGFLFLKARKKEKGEPRFGFVVSKKISNKAVVRNKVKRRMREAVRALIPDIKEPFDCVFIAFPGIEKAGWKEIKREVTVLLRRSGVSREG